MKAVKIYLVVVTLLLIGAIGLGVYAWYKIQQLSAVAPVISETETSVAETTKTPTASTPEPITITSDSLSPTQQKMLETFGYTQDSFTITPTMIVCAENAVGKTRLDEIVAGSAPSPFESVKLLPCFKK